MDTMTPSERSARMRRIRSTNTGPELAVRRWLHSLGYRFRLHARELPGRPDIVFPRRRAALFVHGCFWHRHGSRCALTRVPKSRQAFWLAKFEDNVRRDRRKLRALRALGWRVMVVWECQSGALSRHGARIIKFLEEDRT